MLKKRLIPIIFLLAAAAVLVVCQSEPASAPDTPETYLSPYFEGVSRSTVELKNEITLARVAVANGDIGEGREKYFEPEIKAVLLDIEEIITAAKGDVTDAPVIVYIDGIDEGKIQTFAECFPYNCYIFRDGTNYTPVYTKDVAAEIGRAWRAVRENNKTADTKKYFNKDIKSVLKSLTLIGHSANSFDFTATITVEMLDLTQEKIEIFKKYFPYDYYVFGEGSYAEF